MTPTSPAGGRLAAIFRFVRRLVGLLAVAAVLLAALGGWYYEEAVVREPGPGFTRAEILAIIQQESPVYYRDGTTPLGVFFDEEHRRYVPFKDLPADWVHAIIAAEDGNFFLHPGVDPKHIIRAIVQNFKAGEVVAGGSTITQQTAKNLYYRPDRTLRSKGVELGNALRLEAHFSKEDILEFYANQFHVSANGRGLGIAARYFFDKEPAQLTTKECAFIAGMVKAPATYNPFLGATEERRARARKAAEDRVSYVLRRMGEDGYLEGAQLTRVQAEPLVFRRGAFQYDRSVALDEVQRELEQPAFIELFERLGIDNPATAGVQIITTLDATAQREGLYALGHHLTDLGPSLESTGPSALRLSDRTVMPMAPGVPLVRHEILVGRVAWSGDALTVDVGGRPCAVPPDAMKRVVPPGRPQGEGAPPQVLRGALPDGAMTLVSVRAVEAQRAVCDLELRPALQGAAVVLEDGELRALVGGSDNRNFDRALQARRQFGSTWKPLVYAASLQLGWLPTDTLDNRRNVFPFRDVYYFPSPDHANVPWLPMTLVGARSENLASVWLLYHLTDPLNPEQLRRVATQVGLTRRPDEAPDAWLRRLRDEEGLRSDPARFEEYAFTLARQDVLGGLAFGLHPEDAWIVRSTLHGRGFAQERARLLNGARTPERELRLAALGQSFLALEELAGRCLSGDPDVLYRIPATGDIVCDAVPPVGALALQDGAGALRGWEAVATWPAEAGGQPVAPDVDLAALAEAWLGRRPIGGALHLSTLRELRAATDRRAAELAGRDPWDPEVLALAPDFRTLVGVRYLQSMIRAAGVTEDVPTTLTLPLGAADLTLRDAAVLYQAALTGNRYAAGGMGFEPGAIAGLRSAFALADSDAPPGLIAEIRDSAGNILYRSTPKVTPVWDRAAGEEVGDILRNVVRVGTGRRAASAVVLGGAALPLVGKTGTTNDYRNAAFVGVAPRTADGQATWGQGYTIAVYVGYDDNRSMRKGALRVQGASGALPAWLTLVQGLADAGMLGEGGAAEYTPSAGLQRVVIPGSDGGIGEISALAPVGLARAFSPYRVEGEEVASELVSAGAAPPAQPVEVASAAPSASPSASSGETESIPEEIEPPPSLGEAPGPPPEAAQVEPESKEPAPAAGGHRARRPAHGGRRRAPDGAHP